jgi:F-type H+-transporting ATPase subunit gamma
MAGRKEIRTKILSVKNTQKITRAMEMVAASKMRRTQDRLKAARPYAAQLERIIFHVAQSTPEYRHPYMEKREGGRVGIIVIGTDRGLCGGLNVNLFRRVFRKAKELSAVEGGAVHWGLIGKKSGLFYASVGADVVAKVEGLGDAPTLQQIRGVVLSMTQMYKEGKLDSIWVASNRFVNTLVQQPRLERLVPIADHEEQALEHTAETEVTAKLGRQVSWDYLYEPEPKDVIDALLERYVEALVFHTVIENGACEMAAKMVAMKNASENAGRLVNELQIAYNKARQAAITQEIAEIVAGAAAV